MDKGLIFQVFRSILPYFCNFPKAKLSGKDNALHTDMIPEIRRLVIGHICLGAEVDLRSRNHLLYQHDDTRIAYDKGVDFKIPYLFQVLPKGRNIPIMGENIYGKIAFRSPGVGKFYALPHFLIGKVSCPCSEGKAFASEIYGICTVQNGYFQFFQISRRSKQLYFFH